VAGVKTDRNTKSIAICATA